jgi:nicotinamide-nucleotide amidase
MSTDDVARATATLFNTLVEEKLTLVTAESCTGGLVAAAITALPGSSQVLERGYVTYSNAAKETDLGVASSILQAKGAVSAETARAMAEGALQRSTADLAVSITGIAGPGGGSEEKPVGLVYFAAARRGGRTLQREMRFGDLGRGEIRRRSVLNAMTLLTKLVDQH